MKKIKSLVAAFTLAAAGVVTMGATSAQAQTVPIWAGQGQVYNQTIVPMRASVSQGAIDDLAYNIGVQTIYYRSGVGFTQGTASDGENIGLEFQLNGSNATVVRAYNLDDPNSASQFQRAVDNAYYNEQRLADNELRARTRIYTYYEPETYIICPPIVPIIGFGWVIGGWHPGYVPAYHRWGGFWDDHGHRNHHYRGNNTTIINNQTTIINGRGNPGPWNGGWRHDNHHNDGQWQRGGDHNRTIINNPPPVYTPPVRHAEPRHVEPVVQPRQRVADAQPRGGHQQWGQQQAGGQQGDRHQQGDRQGVRQHDGGGRGGPGGHRQR
ncbi:MAG: hypothetical protein EPN97_12095 [Alphaproteobacteria bacterium]|nr:MAG: hypothetical protein EPN97_12095 [Alphaproteobacteria bacterium]